MTDYRLLFDMRRGDLFPSFCLYDMTKLEERILKDGKVFPGEVLKVDSFVNHCIDVPFMCELADEFCRLFKDEGINKIVTIEASGIGIACLVAERFGCPAVFAKKSKTSNIGDELYCAPIHSYTHNTDYNVVISKDYICKDDRVLIIDDFLATGAAFIGLIDICRQGGATVAGCGVLIEKAEQGGGDRIRKICRCEALARIKSMTDDAILFVD